MVFCTVSLLSIFQWVGPFSDSLGRIKIGWPYPWFYWFCSDSFRYHGSDGNVLLLQAAVYWLAVAGGYVLFGYWNAKRKENLAGNMRSTNDNVLDL